MKSVKNVNPALINLFNLEKIFERLETISFRSLSLSLSSRLLFLVVFLFLHRLPFSCLELLVEREMRRTHQKTSPQGRREVNQWIVKRKEREKSRPRSLGKLSLFMRIGDFSFWPDYESSLFRRVGVLAPLKGSQSSLIERLICLCYGIAAVDSASSSREREMAI